LLEGNKGARLKGGRYKGQSLPTFAGFDGDDIRGMPGGGMY
jgi:hypothetical protein